MKLVFASNNKNKITEIKALLPSVFKILSLEDIGCTEEIEETENTIAGNAKLKADYITKKYGYDCFADDTGLEVAALNGAPGVYSARYAGKNVTYEENVQKMLKEMKGKGNTILLMTHDMVEADALSDHIAIIDNGKIIAYGTPKELKAEFGGKNIISR